MRLLRLGKPGSERPAALAHGFDEGDEHVVDLADVVTDLEEAFFGGGGLDRIRPTVEERIRTGQIRPIENERIGTSIARPHQIRASGSTTPTTPRRLG